MRALVLSLGLVVTLAACGTKSKGRGGGGTPTPAPPPNPSAAVVSTLKYYNHFPFNNVYTIALDLGGAPLEAVLDTGSSNLLALGDQALCPGCINEYGYDSVYTPGAGAQALGTGWRMNFAPIGQATVEGYADSVAFGGQTLSDFHFGLVKAEQGIPNIWGIAFANLAHGQTPLFDALVANGKLQDEFSLRLCGLKSGSNATLGGYDAAVSDKLDQVQWTPLGYKQWYQITVKKIYLAGAAGAAPAWSWSPAASDTIIVDSGTNPLVLPSAEITPLVQALSAAATQAGVSLPSGLWPTATGEGGFAAVADADIAKLPAISFDLESAADPTATFTVTVAPSTYFQTREDGQRYVGIQPGPPAYILGTVFMENFVVLHDRTGSGRLGFYPNAGLCN
jgi:hypothetical protein